MPIKLVLTVRNFFIENRSFVEDDQDVLNGHVNVGTHRVLRFDLLVHNASAVDLHLGQPDPEPWVDFILNTLHGHPVATTGRRLCFEDIENIDAHAGPPRYTWRDQGLGVGWATRYNAGLPGQFMVLDEVPQGDYRFSAMLRVEELESYAQIHVTAAEITLRLHQQMALELAERPLEVTPHGGYSLAGLQTERVGQPVSNSLAS